MARDATMTVTGQDNRWQLSGFSGLFREYGAVAPRPHDPDVAIWAGTVANRALGDSDAVGGAGWTAEQAEMAGIGEAIERWQTHRLASDHGIHLAFSAWPHIEPEKGPAISPERWVLFHPGQYQPGFPFPAMTDDDPLDWVCFRRAITGQPHWVPADLAFMDLRPGTVPRFAPAVSTGWSAHCQADLALLRGTQEVIERDAMVGAWWGIYAMREHRPAAVMATLPPWLPARVERGNLRYRFYHIESPYSAHVTMVTMMGDDREGGCFSIGSACRESRAESWQKALLEAIQGRHYVRYWKPRMAETLAPGGQLGGPVDGNRRVPTTFREHALWYSYAPERLDDTVLASCPGPDRPGSDASIRESLATLCARLGERHPVLFRVFTPPAITAENLGWVVIRVMIPGLQPLHGDHRIPFLGGSMWRDRPLTDWTTMPPHPFA